MLRRLALLTSFAVSATACSQGLCPRSTDTCIVEPSPPAPSMPSNDSGDSHDYILPVAVGATVLTAVLLLAMRSNDREDKPAASGPPPVRFASTPSEDTIERMFVQGHALARAGRCDGVQSVGRNLARIAYEDFKRYTADPAIAVCYAGAT